VGVRTRRLFGPTPSVASTPTLLYEVPADRVAVVRGLSVINASTTAATVVQLELESAGMRKVIWRADGLGSLTTAVYPAYLVLNPGDKLWQRMDPVAATGVWNGSGSLLLGPPE
jgi:hypothetical protein